MRLRRVGAFEWQLLVVEEAIGEQGVVVGHRNLHRLDDALKLLNAGEDLLHGRQVPSRRLGMGSERTQMGCEVLLPVFEYSLHGLLYHRLQRVFERDKSLIQGLAENCQQIVPGQIGLHLNGLEPRSLLHRHQRSIGQLLMQQLFDGKQPLSQRLLYHTGEVSLLLLLFTRKFSVQYLRASSLLHTRLLVQRVVKRALLLDKFLRQHADDLLLHRDETLLKVATQGLDTQVEYLLHLTPMRREPLLKDAIEGM